jgi:hypothetical protein
MSLRYINIAGILQFYSAAEESLIAKSSFNTGQKLTSAVSL